MINLSSGCVTSTVISLELLCQIFPVHPPQDPQCDLHNSLRAVPLQHLIHYVLSVSDLQLALWDGRKAKQLDSSQVRLKCFQLFFSEFLQTGQQQSWNSQYLGSRKR